jgi:hypothetical protein
MARRRIRLPLRARYTSAVRRHASRYLGFFRHPDLPIPAKGFHHPECRNVRVGGHVKAFFVFFVSVTFNAVDAGALMLKVKDDTPQPELAVDRIEIVPELRVGPLPYKAAEEPVYDHHRLTIRSNVMEKLMSSGCSHGIPL